jgi:hypothetical protein
VSADQVIAKNVEELEELSGWVHDAWFDLEQLHFTADEAEATLPVLGFEERRGRLLGFSSYNMTDEQIGTLAIRNVRAVHVQDEAEVRYYSIGYLTAVEDGRVVQLHANIPLRVDFRVDAVHVEFTPTDAYDRQPWG